MSERTKIEDAHSEWFGLLSDAAKAEVMKAQITESALTERHRITEQATTDRERIQSDRSVKHESYNNESYNWVRFAFILLLAACVAGATCVEYHKIELKSQSTPASVNNVDANVSGK